MAHAIFTEFNVGDKVEITYYVPPRIGTVIEVDDNRGVHVRYDDVKAHFVSEIWIDCSETPQWINKLDVLF